MSRPYRRAMRAVPVRPASALAACLALAAAAGLLSACGAQKPRDRVAVVGSSTLFPFSAAAAEQFSARGLHKTPRVESTGTGGGFAIFCRGVGQATPDIANASRRIKRSEYDTCAANGVTEIVEIKIGHDGIVLANVRGGAHAAFSKLDIWRALAKDVWSEARQAFIPNPYKRWSEVNPALPDIPIDVMGPPPTSGTRDAFVELVLEKGAAEDPAMAQLKESDPDGFKARASTLREDGAWKDSGENDNLIVQALSRSPGQFGVFGFSFYEENLDRLQAAPVNGIAPTMEAIVSGEYAASRSLYFYVKKAHVDRVPGLHAFAMELVSEPAGGLRGYLRERGMAPLKPEDRARSYEVARSLTAMQRPDK